MPHDNDKEMRDRARHALGSQIDFLERLAADGSSSNGERLEALRLLADIVRLLDRKPHPKGPKHDDEHEHHRHGHHRDDHHHHDHGPKGHAAKKHGAKHAAKKHAAKKRGRHERELARGDESDVGPRRLAGGGMRGLAAGPQAKRLGP